MAKILALQKLYLPNGRYPRSIEQMRMHALNGSFKVMMCGRSRYIIKNEPDPMFHFMQWNFYDLAIAYRFAPNSLNAFIPLNTMHNV